MVEAPATIGDLAAQAETALQDGDVAHARTLLQRALEREPRNVRLLQLAAQTAEAGGQRAMAVSLLQTALRLAPENRDTLSALFALCLEQQNIAAAGQLLARDRAIAGEDAAHLLLQAKWALAICEEEQAESALAQLCDQAPDHHEALAMQARLAMRRGRAQAPQLFQRARKHAANDVALLRDHARSHASQGDYDAALALLHGALERGHPDASLTTDKLALLEESGQVEAGQTALAEAREHASNDTDLRMALGDLMMQRDNPHDALTLLAGQRCNDDPWEVRLAEAQAAGMAGELDHAEQILVALQDTGHKVPPLILARHLIRRHRFGDGEALLQQQLERDPGNISAWALIDCIWRSIGKLERHRWLHDPDRVTANLDLGLSAEAVAEAVNWLRQQHHARAAPTGQSLRHGTQTGGAILSFDDDIARMLRHHIGQAIARYIAQWPETDAHHPLLRLREQKWRFRGSWSVRLGDGGHHKAHIHPEGHISSASYWVLPDSETPDDTAGALELGRPPDDLRLDLPPLRTIAPRTGHLVLFPSSLYHGTRSFTAGERLTLAFDATFMNISAEKR
ncbi:MAG: putative 2OG-Fe(II) oxygenase [Pseudomonadota bacterium]